MYRAHVLFQTRVNDFHSDDVIGGSVNSCLDDQSYVSTKGGAGKKITNAHVNHHYKYDVFYRDVCGASEDWIHQRNNRVFFCCTSTTTASGQKRSTPPKPTEFAHGGCLGEWH